MRVFSFGHILTKQVKDDIKKIVKERYNSQEGIGFNSVEFHIDMKKDMYPQIKEILKRSMEGQTNGEAPIIAVPGLSVASAIIVAILHGVYGRFPLIAELTRSGQTWKLKKIHNLDSYRTIAREDRFSN